MQVILTEHPETRDWQEVKRRAWLTIGKTPVIADPGDDWKYRILNARHSPIRYLRFSFDLIDIPYFVSVHLCRHVHAQPYVRSQRNDRQKIYDRNAARQDAPVNMIWDLNAEELMVIANKRLCTQASKETRDIVKMMCDEVVKANPEFKDFLVPACEYNGNVCHEFYSCWRAEKRKENDA